MPTVVAQPGMRAGVAGSGKVARMFSLVPMLLPAWLNPENILNAMGNWALWGVVLIVVAECGLFCFFMPGDSLLFAVGMFIALGTIHFGALHPGVTLVIACVILSAAAIAGNAIGYWLGRLIGPPLFRPRTGLAGRILNPKYVAQTHDFFEKHGHMALILARFVPIVRTFVTLVAGVAKMSFPVFISYSGVGGILWGTGVTMLGFFLGKVQFIHDHIEVVLVLIVLVSLVPMGVEFLRHRTKKAPVAAA